MFRIKYLFQEFLQFLTEFRLVFLEVIDRFFRFSSIF